jgi:hypothetical protein
MKLAEIKRIVALLVTAGTQAAASQIVNGDFSSGLNSFSSSYAYVPANAGVFTQPGDFGLTTNPSTGFTNPYTSYTDHTGDATGLMLIADGYNPGVDVWAETVTVSPSTAYVFTAWVASAYVANPARLGLFSNGQQIGTSFSAPSTAGLWTEWTAFLTTGPADSNISLSIQDLNLNVFGAGNDFTLDDLALNGAATALEPASWLLVGSVLLGFFVSCLRRRRGRPPVVTNRQGPNDLLAKRARRILGPSALVLTAFLAPTAARASAMLGVISYNALIPGAPRSPGVNDFEIDNFTGGFVLPPDFPVTSSLAFQNSSLLLTLQGGTQSTILLGDLTPGVYTPDALQFSAATGFSSALFTATLDQTSLSVPGGPPLQASSALLSVELTPSSGPALVQDSDFTFITVATTPLTTPEPNFAPFGILVSGAILALSSRIARS